MGKAQFLVSADVMASLVRDVVDFPWPGGTIILEEDDSEWKTKRRLHVTFEHPSIPETMLEPLWCNPSWHHNESGDLVFESWNFREDWIGVV